MRVREAQLYTEKIEEADIRNLFDQIVKAKLPFLGFLDFSGIFSLGAIKLVIKRRQNTVTFYVKEKESLGNLSALVFPFKFSEATDLPPSKGSLMPPKFYMISGGSHDFLDFMLKGSIEEVQLSVSKILGGFIGFGTATDEKGRKGLMAVFSPTKFFMVNMEKNPSVYIEVLEPVPKRMATTSSFPVFEETGMTLGMDNFDPFQHTLVAGTSGTGKTKALYVLIRALQARHGNRARILVIDPHGEFLKLLPDAKIVNFVSNYIEPLDVGQQKTPMLTQLVAQLVSSTIGQENKYAERVLFYAVHLLTSLDKLELKNISALLTDPSVKAEFVSQTENEEVKRFFDAEFNDIYIHHFNDAILPILNFIGEYELYLGKARKRENLLDLLKQNNLTVVSFDPHFFGRRMISFLASAITNQMYILAITESLMDRPTVMVIDEFPRVETRVTRDILTETRKFNLFAYLSCQYLGQLSKEVLDSIISNVRNIIAFKVTRQDATMLSSVMEIKIEESFKKHRTTTELEESKKELFVRLHQRECIVRLYDGTKYLLPMKLRVVDTRKWGFDEEAAKLAPKRMVEEEPKNPPSQPPTGQPPGTPPAGQTVRGQPPGAPPAGQSQRGQFAGASYGQQPGAPSPGKPPSQPPSGGPGGPPTRVPQEAPKAKYESPLDFGGMLMKDEPKFHTEERERRGHALPPASKGGARDEPPKHEQKGEKKDPKGKKK